MATVNDTIVNDAQAQAVFSTLDLKDFFEENVSAADKTTKQTVFIQAPLQKDTAEATASFLKTNRGQRISLQANANSTGVISKQTTRMGNTVVQSHRIARPVVQSRVDALNTVEALAGGTAAPTNSFSERIKGAAVVVTQRRHTQDLITQDVNATLFEASAKLRQQLRDQVTNKAGVSNDVIIARLQARNTLNEAAEVIDELLEALAKEVWVFNAQTLAFSRYTDTPATGVISVDGEPLFTSSKGLRQFADDQFTDTEVEWGLSNFNSLALKRLVSAYVVSAGDAELTLSARHSLNGKVQEHRYKLPAVSSLAPVTRRYLMARGFQGQYWGLRLETSGGRVMLNNVVITPLVNTRRV